MKTGAAHNGKGAERKIGKGILALCLCAFAPLCLFAGVEQHYGKLYSDGPAGKKEFALTYDDGPGYITADLLALLAKYQAKATFFMNGASLRKYPETAARVAAAGHLIGNHTDSHGFYPEIGKRAGREKALEREIDAAAALIEKSAGKRPLFLRMPNGYDRGWVRKVAARRGCVLVNWSYGSDWTGVSEEKMAAGYLKNLAPGRILLLHDGGGKSRERTLRLTEKILLEARNKGLAPVTLEELLDIRTVNGK